VLVDWIQEVNIMMTMPERAGSDSLERARAARGFHDTHLARTLELIDACGLRPHDPIIDVGSAAEPVVRALAASGYSDITVLNPSLGAHMALQEHPGGASEKMTLLHQEFTHFRPQRRYALWIDRGLFHYLTYPEDRQEYIEVLQQALRPEGHLVIAAFGPDAPEEYEGVRVMRYSARSLLAALGKQFELDAGSLAVHELASGGTRQFLHARFHRHAPCWPR
jgi:hypothetical protein